MKLYTSYYCTNGAYHTYNCCDTCWNKHPKAVKGEMFQYTDRCYEIIKEQFIEKAIKNGFNKKQAEFLYEQLN